MNDEELAKAAEDAMAKDPIMHKIDWSKMSTGFLKQVVEYFEGTGKSELQYPDSKEAYANAKAALNNKLR